MKRLYQFIGISFLSILVGLALGTIPASYSGFITRDQTPTTTTTTTTTTTESALLVTGQTTSYVNFDDGYYQKGVAKSYTVYTTGQYSGTTSITVNSKVDNHSNNVVYDNKTTLMWSRYISGSVGPGSDGKLPWTTTGAAATAEGIFPYCAAANTMSLAGYSDWRIPNINEITSLLDYSGSYGRPNSAIWPVWSSAQWSSTTSKAVTTEASRLYDGGSNFFPKTGTFQISLVRGGV